MKMLSTQEAMAWCRTHGVTLAEYDLPDRSDADQKFAIPQDAGRRVYLVGRAMESFRDGSPFLVWFNDWGVWPSGQRMHVFERFRMSYGETRPLIDAPAQLFDAAEIEDGISFVTIAALFLWDCYVVNPGRTKLLFLSHDEYGVTKGGGLEPDGPRLTIVH